MDDTRSIDGPGSSSPINGRRFSSKRAKFMMDSSEGSLYREPTCMEKCILGFKCGFGTGLVFGLGFFAVGASKAGIPKGQKWKVILANGTLSGLALGSVFTGIVRLKC